MKVLIVDDEEMIRGVLKEYVEFEGGTAYEAADGMQAVKMCRENDFDIILMDIMMPKLGARRGIRQAVRFRNRRRRLRYKAVFTKRGYGAHSRGVKARRAGNAERRGYV